MNPAQCILAGLVLLAVLHPSVTCLRIAWRLFWARRVVVEDYGSWRLTPGSLLTEVTLTPSQAWDLALVLCGPRGMPTYPKCILVPHHVIRIHSRGGRCHLGIICFTCRQAVLSTTLSEGKWVGDLGWRASALEKWFRRHGIPVRLDFYKKYEEEEARQPAPDSQGG